MVPLAFFNVLKDEDFFVGSTIEKSSDREELKKQIVVQDELI